MGSLIKLLLVTSTVIQIQFGDCYGHLHVTQNGILEDCLKLLINSHFSVEKTVVYVTANNTISNIPNLITHPQIIIKTEKDIQLNLTANYNYVIYTKGYISLNKTLYKLKSSSLWNKNSSPRAKYIAILPEVKHFQDILTVFCNFDVISVILVVRVQERDDWKIKLFGSQSCSQGALKKQEMEINVSGFCDDMRIIRIFFKQKLENYKGRKLKLLLHQNRLLPTLVDPFLLPYPGILISLIRLIGEKTNTVVYNVIQNLTNGSVINNRTKDIILVYFLARDVKDFENYDVSNLIYQDSVVWIVPKALQISSVKIIAFIFGTSIWIATISGFLIISTSWYVIAKISSENPRDVNFGRCALSVFIAIVSSPDNITPKANPLRCLMIFHIIFCMNISENVQTKLISRLLHPGTERGIKTIHEMVNSNLLPIVSKLAFRQLNNSEHEEAKYLLPRCYVSATNITENVYQVAYYRNRSTHIGRELLSTYRKERDLVDIISFNAGLQDIELSIALRKGHPFLPIANKLIVATKEYGLLQKWLSDLGKFKYSEKLQFKNVVLTLEHLKVIFVLWIIGLTVSSVVFLIEYLGRIIIKMIRKKIITTAQDLIDFLNLL